MDEKVIEQLSNLKNYKKLNTSYQNVDFQVINNDGKLVGIGKPTLTYELAFYAIFGIVLYLFIVFIVPEDYLFYMYAISGVLVYFVAPIVASKFYQNSYYFTLKREFNSTLSYMTQYIYNDKVFI